MKKLLLTYLLAVVATTTMEKAEDRIHNLPLQKKIWLLEAYMRGEITIQDTNGLCVIFTRYYSRRPANNIVRLKDAIVWLSEAKRECRISSVELPKLQKPPVLNEEIILQMQLLRYRTFCDCDDLFSAQEAQKKSIAQARENWEDAFLSQGTKELIEQELKNKNIFAAKFAPLQKVVSSTSDNIIEVSCAPEKLPEPKSWCLIS